MFDDVLYAFYKEYKGVDTPIMCSDNTVICAHGSVLLSGSHLFVEKNDVKLVKLPFKKDIILRVVDILYGKMPQVQECDVPQLKEALSYIRLKDSVKGFVKTHLPHLVTGSEEDSQDFSVVLVECPVDVITIADSPESSSHKDDNPTVLVATGRRDSELLKRKTSSEIAPASKRVTRICLSDDEDETVGGPSKSRKKLSTAFKWTKLRTSPMDVPSEKPYQSEKDKAIDETLMKSNVDFWEMPALVFLTQVMTNLPVNKMRNVCAVCWKPKHKKHYKDCTAVNRVNAKDFVKSCDECKQNYLEGIPHVCRRPRRRQ